MIGWLAVAFAVGSIVGRAYGALRAWTSATREPFVAPLPWPEPPPPPEPPGGPYRSPAQLAALAGVPLPAEPDVSRVLTAIRECDARWTGYEDSRSHRDSPTVTITIRVDGGTKDDAASIVETLFAKIEGDR